MSDPVNPTPVLLKFLDLGFVERLVVLICSLELGLGEWWLLGWFDVLESRLLQE